MWTALTAWIPYISCTFADLPSSQPSGTHIILHAGLCAAGFCARRPLSLQLAVVIGRPCKDVPAEEALQYVLGYTIANDVTARRWQGKKGGGQWARSKSFDSFLPLGPYLVPSAEVPDPQALRIRTCVNDNCVQDGSTADMVHSVAQLIAFLSQDTTLLPGTVILTGTPAGVGYVKDRYLRSGDVVRIEIERLGVLRNVVVEEV